MKNEMNDDRFRIDRTARPDFGPDADVVPDDDPAFDAWIRTVAPTLNAPNATPRLEMWAAIQTARRTAVAPPRRKPWLLISAIAAALLLGVAIDRVALRSVEGPGAPVVALPAPPPEANDPSRLYRMAATQTLTQAEALLTAFRTSPQSPVGTQQLGTWGRQVLGSTRLLIDSPAGTDPKLRALLEDLELVLVQIIQLSGAELSPTDRALIEGALEHSDLLPRIRTAVPAGAPGTNAVSGD